MKKLKEFTKIFTWGEFDNYTKTIIFINTNHFDGIVTSHGDWRCRIKLMVNGNKTCIQEHEMNMFSYENDKFNARIESHELSQHIRETVSGKKRSKSL
jgi:hypothetical protein